MKTSAYKNYDDLPLFLNASLVAQVLGVSPSSGYELMHVVVTTHRRILQRQKEYDRRRPRDALCAPISAPAAHLTRPNSANRCTALERRKARDEEKQEKAPALLPRRCGHNRPQCGRFQGRRLTLF